MFAAPLKSFKYTIDIKINASNEAVIERLRALILGQKFPMCVKKGMKISSANINAGRNISGVIPLCLYLSYQLLLCSLQNVNNLFHFQCVSQIQAKLSASVRINTLGPLNNALNMAFVATVKMVRVDASLLFQLKERSADQHLVKSLPSFQIQFGDWCDRKV